VFLLLVYDEPEIDCDPDQLSTEEQSAIISFFKTPANALASGVRLGGKKFITLSANDRSIYGKAGVRLDVLSIIMRYSSSVRIPPLFAQ
jgi:hypothetical protein